MSNSVELSLAKARFDRAAAKFQADKKTLFMSDGSKFYGDTEHARRLAEFTQPLTEAAAHVKQVAQAAREAAQAARVVQFADPIAVLTDAELGRAFHLRPFVNDAVEAMPLEQLAQRLSAVNATGDKAAIVCYAKASHRKVEALREASRTGRSVSLEGISDVTELIEELTNKLASPKHTAQLAEANKLETEATEISMAVNHQVRDLDGSSAKAQERANLMYQEQF